uniref:Mobilization protein n=1 Tax=Prevotella sp. GTC17254 TaxID=3236794 RepID=A0AB33J2T2_9BACT
MKAKTDKEKRNKGDNKTQTLRIRCSEEEKTRIQKRAERTGKKLSEFGREALLTGEIVAVPQLGEHEREAIRVLQRVSYFFSHISNLIKTKDPSWVPIVKNLSCISLHAFERFYSPRYRITDEVYDVLNIKRNDS